MAKCHRNNVATVLLHRDHGTKHARLWTPFSAASFRRLILESVICGGGKTSKKRSEPDRKNTNQPISRSTTDSVPSSDVGSEKLSELLKKSEVEEEDEHETFRKEKALEEMKGAVKKLQNDDILGGAIEVRRLAKESADARTILALLGAIPPLLAMLDSVGDDKIQIESLYALLNLGIGNDANKAAIVKAGAIHKMLKLIESPNPAIAEAIVANFLGLTALDSNKPIIGSSGAIPFLVNTLKDTNKTNSAQSKHDSLRALYNLSISPINVHPIVETDLVPFMFCALGEMEVSEWILSILSNIVSTHEGRKALSGVPNSLQILIDVLNWTDSSGCQEKASYVLMVLAHKSYGDRQTMIEAGIASSLLELTLLGSTLSQKRASRILECLRIGKGKQVSGVTVSNSAPMYGSSSAYTNTDVQSNEQFGSEEEDMMSEERKAVKQLVQQSLQNNMRRIVKRANLPHDFVPSDHLKSLTACSTSKSLPF